MPLPSSPNPLNPQHQADPSVCRPQACISPALICSHNPPPATGVGLGTTSVLWSLTTLPSPSWPRSLVPQHHPVLSSLTPHVNSPPELITVQLLPPTTGTGTASNIVALPVPSCPELLGPKQIAILSVVMPHVLPANVPEKLTLTIAQAKPPGTSTGT